MQELLSGIVVDGKGVRHSVQLSCLVVPSLSQNLFSVKQAARNGVTHMLDIDNPRLEANNFTLLLQELGCGLYSFSLDLTDKICTQELVMQATAKATRWHRRLENLNHKCSPTEKEEYWPFAPTDEPAASFGYSTSGDIPTDASGIFGAFGGVTGEGAGSAVFMVKQGPVRGLGFRDRITGGLDFIVRALAMIVMIHYLWLSVGSSPYARVVSKTTPDIFGGITGTATSRLVRSILSRGRETTESTAP